MTDLIRLSLLAFLLVLCPGCATDSHASEKLPVETEHGQEDVLRIARRAAQREGIDLREYIESRARQQKDGNWYVFFQGKVAMPGNHFSVEVNPRTGESRLFRGK